MISRLYFNYLHFDHVLLILFFFQNSSSQFKICEDLQFYAISNFHHENLDEEAICEANYDSTSNSISDLSHTKEDDLWKSSSNNLLILNLTHFSFIQHILENST